MWKTENDGLRTQVHKCLEGETGHILVHGLIVGRPS